MAAVITTSAAQVSGPRTVWDAVYSAEQARRGERLAMERCVACHGDNLSGGELAPPLAGSLFTANWDGILLSDLVDRVRTTMPLDMPGTLSRQQTVDIVTYMLSVGKFPSGETPLATDGGTLGQITFRSLRPEP